MSRRRGGTPSGLTLGLRVAITTSFFAVALACRAQAQSAPDRSADIEFHSPFNTSSAENTQEFRDKYFLGDWKGIRPKFENRGIRFALLLITDPFGNVAGGLRRGASDYSLVAVGVLFDTGRLGGWRGGTLHIGFADNFGTSLSKNYVGNNFPVQLADVADAHPRLTYLSYTQELFEQKLSIRFGRLTINSVSHEEFLGSEYFKAFTSVGIDLVPLGLFFNAPGAFGFPDTTWGARARLQPSDRFYAMVGTYNGDPSLKNGTHHGLDFSLRGPLFLIGEVGVRKGPANLNSSHNLKFGGYYNGGSGPTRGPNVECRQPEAAGGCYGLYVLGDHVLRRWGDSNQDRRLGTFGALVVAPNNHVNRLPYFFDTGLVAYGPFQNRPKDFAGVAVVYGAYSKELLRSEIPTNSSAHRFEMTVEGNYGVSIRPGFLLQPSIQFIVHPSGNPTVPSAVVIGTNIVVNW